jgi:hypothetical protein
MLFSRTGDKSPREVGLVEGALTAKDLGCPFFETSAKTGANIEDIFKNLIKLIDESRYVNRRRISK